MSDRFGKWGSARAGKPPSASSDRPGYFDDRFGNWGSGPAGSFGDFNSLPAHAPEKYGGSAAPDGPSSVAAASAHASEPGFGPQRADELYAARSRVARLLGGAGGYVEDSLIPSVGSASPSPALYGGPTTDAGGSPLPLPVRRLVGQIADDPRVAALDKDVSAASAPFTVVLPDHRTDYFRGRFGDWASTAAGDTPQQLPDSTPPYSEMFRQYLNQLTTGQSQAPASPSNVNTPTPYPSVPPMFAPPDYSSATGNGSIKKWIASLGGVDPDDPTQFHTPPMFSPLYRR